MLPANPLQDLSDESLEGFVDCTLYEETMSGFLAAGDRGEEEDEPPDPPPPRVTRTAPPASVPAMPFDTPPNVMVRALGNSESLTVAPEEPLPVTEPAEPPAFALTSTAALFAPLSDARAASAAPWLEAASATYGQGFASDDSRSDPGYMPGDAAAAMTVRGHVNPAQRVPAYPADVAPYAPYTAAHPAAPSVVSPEMLPETTVRIAPAWQRWLAICGTAAVAVVIAFVLARLVRGSTREEPAAVAASATTIAPRAAPAPGPRPASPGGSGGEARQGAAPDHKVVAAAEPAGTAEPASGAGATGTAGTTGTAGPGSADAPADPVSPDDDGEASSGGTPVVGSGPCRFTVATTPAGSSVRLDDQAMGASPITIDGTCDKHKIDVSHARYQSVTRWVTLAADRPQQLDISLPRPVHAVTVTSSPPGAELSIDGHRAGTTPTIIQMTGFATVNLTFTKPGFQSVTKKVYSKLPQDRVFVKLVR